MSAKTDLKFAYWFRDVANKTVIYAFHQQSAFENTNMDEFRAIYLSKLLASHPEIREMQDATIFQNAYRDSRDQFMKMLPHAQKLLVKFDIQGDVRGPEGFPPYQVTVAFKYITQLVGAIQHEATKPWYERLSDWFVGLFPLAGNLHKRVLLWGLVLIPVAIGLRILGINVKELIELYLAGKK